VTQIKYVLPNITDIGGHRLQADIEFALKNRLIDVEADGNFHPEHTVTREDFARALVLNSASRQSLAASPRFSDVSADFSRIADSVAANGPTLRDYDFSGSGLLVASGSTFNPLVEAGRLDMAVAFVRALGHDREARALANTDVIFDGSVISDNAQIPGALRGYVQIAINNGLFETFPAGVIETSPGQYQVVPGPRFDPFNEVSRAVLAEKLNKYHLLFTTGG
jgi:hypothetical protein